MAKQSAAFKIGQLMAKKAQGFTNLGAPQNVSVGADPAGRPTLQLGDTAPKKAPGIYMGGQQVSATTAQPVTTPQETAAAAPAPATETSMTTTPNPTPTTAKAPPVTTSPTQPAQARPNPAVSSSPAQGQQPRRPLPASLRMPKYSSAHKLGQAMAKRAVDEQAKTVFKKIVTRLAKRAGLNNKDVAGMEKSAIAWLPLLAGLIPGLGLAYGGYKFGKGEGWWDSPAIKAMKDRMKAIQMAKGQGIDPARMGLIQPKPEKSKPWEDPQYKDYSSWGSGTSSGAGIPKGYMKTEKDIQNLAKNLQLAGRHSQAFSRLARMPVFS